MEGKEHALLNIFLKSQFKFGRVLHANLFIWREWQSYAPSELRFCVICIFNVSNDVL